MGPELYFVVEKINCFSTEGAIVFAINLYQRIKPKWHSIFHRNLAFIGTSKGMKVNRIGVSHSIIDPPQAAVDFSSFIIYWLSRRASNEQKLLKAEKMTTKSIFDCWLRDWELFNSPTNVITWFLEWKNPHSTCVKAFFYFDSSETSNRTTRKIPVAPRILWFSLFTKSKRKRKTKHKSGHERHKKTFLFKWKSVKSFSSLEKQFKRKMVCHRLFH